MNFFYGFILASITFTLGDLAYTLTFTLNENNIGGVLPFAFLTFAPLAFFLLGRVYPD